MKYQSILLSILLFILSAWFVDTDANPNAVSRALPVISILDHQTWAIDAFESLTIDKSKVGDHFYSEKAPFTSLLVIPFDWALEKIKASQNFDQKLSRVLTLGDLFTGILPFFGINLLILRKIHQKWLIFPFLFASFLWAFSGIYFGHLLAAFFLIIAYQALFEKNKPAWGGFWLGLGFMTEYPVALAFPLWGIWLFIKEKTFLKPFKFFLGIFPSFLFIGIYNQMITGSPFKMIYSFVVEEAFAPMKKALGFSFPTVEGLYGLILSPSRGLLLFAPACIWGIYWILKKINSKRAITLFTHPAFLFFILSLFLFSSYYMWNGGWTYGPRHLIPAYALLCYVFLPWLDLQKPGYFAGVIYASMGFFPTLMAKLTTISIPDMHQNPIFTFILPQFIKGPWNQNALPERLFGLSPSLNLLSFFIILFLFLFLLIQNSSLPKK